MKKGCQEPPSSEGVRASPSPLPMPYRHALKATPAIYTPCHGYITHPHTYSQCWLLPPVAEMVKKAFGAEPAGAAGSRAGSLARLLAPKRLHLRSGLCGCISASGSFVKQASSHGPVQTRFWQGNSAGAPLLQSLWHPRGGSALPGDCFSCCEAGGHCCAPHTNPLPKMRQIFPAVPSSVPPEEEPLQFFQARSQPYLLTCKSEAARNAGKPQLIAVSRP